MRCKLCDETDDLILVGHYHFCPVHKEYVKEQNDKNNPKNNGSKSSLKSLQNHRATKKDKRDVLVPVALRLQENPLHFSSLLVNFKDWLSCENAIIYDTESDGRGATHTLEKTREYFFFNLATKETLHILRRTKSGQVNPDYSHEQAVLDIRSFCQNARFLIAYEPPSNDRNRLKSLLGETVFEAEFQEKCIDFKNSVVQSLFTTKTSQEHARIYLRGLTQAEVYQDLFQVGSHSFPEPGYFLSIPEHWKKDVNFKCRLDVYQLHNLFVLFKSILLNKSM